MGKNKRDVPDQNGVVQGQKCNEPSNVMDGEDAQVNHRKKKKKRDKLRGEDACQEILGTKFVAEDVNSVKKKKKHKHRDKEVEPQDCSFHTDDDNHSPPNEECHKKKKKKHRHKKEIEETTFNEDTDQVQCEETVDVPKKKKKKKRDKTDKVPCGEDVRDAELEEIIVVPKKKRKRKHNETEEITAVEDSICLQHDESVIVPKKKTKRKHKETEETVAGDDADSIEREESVVAPKKKKKRKHKTADSPADEQTERVERSSGDDDTVDISEQRRKAETEAKKDESEETKAKLKQEWQDKTSLKKLRMQQPKMFLIDNFTNSEDPKLTFKPVDMQDLQDLIQYSVMGNAATINKLRFCKLIRPVLISKVAVIILNGVTDAHFQKNKECFSYLNETYDLTGQISPLPAQQRESLLHQLLYVAISKKQLRKRAHFAKVRGVAPTQTGATPKTTPSPAKTPPSATPGRTHYLLSEEEKAMWRYPQADDPKYTHTKHSDRVGDTSPLVSVDCEMCVTKKGSELTRVSLVGEKHQLLYNSLVKPHNPIVDYVTRYSGITKELLDPVTVRLDDVQRDIIALLPSDAILVGQSLENDLQALKLYHPHVIDTSHLFTGSYRVALRKLAWKYLGISIHGQDTGHDSVEDANVALKLLQLKIEKGSNLGRYTSNATNKQTTEIVPTESVFRCAQSLGRVCMLVDRTSVAKQFMKDPVGAIPCQSDAEALKKTIQSVPYSYFVCVQFYNFSKLMQGMSLEGDVVKETLKQLDQRINKIYKILPLNSFFLVVMATDPNDVSNKESNVKNSQEQGRFFTGLKLKY